MPITKLTPETAYPYKENRLSALQQVVPEAFTDGKIDWEILREVLGEFLEDEDTREEHFGLSWPGKREARKLAAQPSKGTLVPCPGEGINEEDTENIFIEGDNLEVLKILLKSYAGKIKMIYIDPPYNTGNDFIYNDDFAEPLEAYLEYTGAKGEGGELLTTNTRADGRFHSKWLNMMYPRLILARQLLRDDGVIFISIDDNEAQNLRQLMNEIFGEENFVESIIWKRKTGAGAKTNGFIRLHEYILCYMKDFSSINSLEAPLSEKTRQRYNQRDEHYEKLGPFSTWPLGTTSMDDRPNLRYPIIHEGVEIWPRKQWLWSKSKTEKAQAENKLVFNYNDKNGSYHVRFKGYLRDENGVEKKGTPLSFFEGPYTQEGTKDIQEFFNRDIFSFPKPVRLIQKLLAINPVPSQDGKEIVLDFFAGSGSTAQAVIEQNAEDFHDRKFILIQMPEDSNRNDFPTIAEVAKERIRRVIKSKQEKQVSTDTQKSLFADKQKEETLGFKVYKLDESQLDTWQGGEITNVDQVQSLFDSLTKKMPSQINDESLAVEIMMIEGFPLTSNVLYIESVSTNQVYQVAEEEFCDHDLYVCLDEEIKPETISQLPMDPKHDIFVCRDSALSDEVKARLIDQYTVHVV